METKIIDGVEYIIKESVDSFIQEKISKYAKRARESEQQIALMNEQISTTNEKLKTVDNLTEQIYGLKEELNQSNTKYERHSSIAQLGITDPDVRDALEWSFKRAETESSFGDWLHELKENPTNAPSFLRSHFEQKPPATNGDVPKVIESKQTPQTKQQIKTNANAIQSNNLETHKDLLSRGLNDPEFYKSNRESIRNAWFTQNNTKEMKKY